MFDASSFLSVLKSNSNSSPEFGSPLNDQSKSLKIKLSFVLIDQLAM